MENEKMFMTDGPGMAYDPNRRSPMEMMGSAGPSMYQAQMFMQAHPAKIVNGNTCSLCGTTVDIEAKFCTECGAKLLREDAQKNQ